jgi:hypothetical protein
MKKLKQRIFKWLTGVDVDKLKNQSEVNGLIPTSSSGLNDNYLFDFKNYSSQYSNNGNGFMNPSIVSFGGVERTDIDDSNSKKPIQKIKVKPIDVLNELETIPNPFTLTLIDEKIEILKDKSELITQEYAKREINALIERLENRKKFDKNRAFFDKFQNTTDEKIDALLSKYDLIMKTSDIFVPEFPDEAVLIMKKYTQKMKLICNKKPVFYVIAEEKDFKKAYEKRDPILLVQSPFGFFWQILGAWDKEMMLLSEL